MKAFLSITSFPKLEIVINLKIFRSCRHQTEGRSLVEKFTNSFAVKKLFVYRFFGKVFGFPGIVCKNRNIKKKTSSFTTDSLNVDVIIPAKAV